jgi:hypothetical protein
MKGSRIKSGMTKEKNGNSLPQKPTSPSNKPFLHYPAMPAFIRLFHSVDKGGLRGALRRREPGAFAARR